MATHSSILGLLWRLHFSKESTHNSGDPGSTPGLGSSPEEGNGNPLQYSCLGNAMDRGTWWATIHGLTRVGHNLGTKPVFLPEESHGQRSLECYNPCRSKESGVTELSI